MDNTIIGALIGVGGTLIGGLSGVLLSKWVNRDATKKAIDLAFPKTVELIAHSELIKAGVRFREAFMDTLNILKSREILQPQGGPTESNIAHYVIDKALPKQREAWNRFRYFLSDDVRRAAFDKAWEDYICREEHRPYEEELDDFEFKGYKSEPLEHHIEMPNRDLAIKRIEKLFTFAEPQEINCV